MTNWRGGAQQDGLNLYVDPHRNRLVLLFVFIGCYAVLFLGMSLQSGIYDEGLVLTAAMRVAAGQVPHRDFYANYGPAQFYILAALFKVFGRSVLIERLFDLLVKALVVTAVYGVARRFSRNWIAMVTAAMAMLWHFGIQEFGAPVLPVSLLNLIGCLLIQPVLTGRESRRWMWLGGATAGLSALFRYDTGVALVTIQACVTAFAVWLRSDGAWGRRVRVFVLTFWPCMAGFLLVIVVPVLFYLSVASARDFVHDILQYPALHYRGARNLPFPGIHVKQIDALQVYLPLPILALSLLIGVKGLLRTRALGGKDRTEPLPWHAFLFVFGLLGAVMYLKGFVRISAVQLYLCTIPTLLLLAVLMEHVALYPRWVRVSLNTTAGLSICVALFVGRVERATLVEHSSVLGSMLPGTAQHRSATERGWCRLAGPFNKGICFLAEDPRLETMEFIRSHTGADQRLFIGVSRHDIIYANDNLSYFGAERLPATHWSHFDPGLQNDILVQRQMVEELKGKHPPYIVIDAEFDIMHEPNDSSKSTGVVVLDDFIHESYKPVATFGYMTVLQWNGKS